MNNIKGKRMRRVCLTILMLGFLQLTAKEIEKEKNEKPEKVYICLGVEGYYPQERGNIFVQSNNYLTIKGEFDENTIKSSFIKKVRKQFYNFSKRGEVTLIVCETTKEARKVQRTINKHKHSLHTRRITFTKHDF